jgi:catechol 2,3-dioxygenase
VVTDQRGKDPGETVFMSASPNEHHQVVLAATGGTSETDAVLGHFAMRVGSLEELKTFRQKLIAANTGPLRCVSHGTTWSVYFRDPENTWIEILTDTPWHVAQPCGFEVDFDQPDAELIEKTEAHVRTLPGFRPRADWFAKHAATIENRS